MLLPPLDTSTPESYQRPGSLHRLEGFVRLTDPPILATMTLSTIVYTIKIEKPTYPMVSTNHRAPRHAHMKPRRLKWTYTAEFYPIEISWERYPRAVPEHVNDQIKEDLSCRLLL